MSFLKKLGFFKPGQPKSPGEVYVGLRQMILTKRPANLEPDTFWGVVMDMGMPNGTATIVAVADGTVSLYTSTGGGIIGLGPYQGPRRAASELLAEAHQFSEYCQPTTEYPLPATGNIRFFLMRPPVTLTAERSQAELAQGKHVLSPLFFKCNELLTEIRKVNEQLGPSRSSDRRQPQ